MPLILQGTLPYRFTNPSSPDAESLLFQAAQSADAALAQILEEVSLLETNVMVVSDHGMAPVHTTVNLNTLLEDAGFLDLDNKDYVIVEKSKAIAFASGGAAHIYINLAGREQDGIVTEEEYTQVLQKLSQLLTSLVDPKTGQPIFNRVVTRENFSSLHLDHANSGDIFVQANPGYHLDSHRGWKNVFSKTSYSGQHGYASNTPEMAAIFIAAGPGVTQTAKIIPPIQIIDLAPTITLLLGLPPNVNMDGLPIPVLIP